MLEMVKADFFQSYVVEVGEKIEGMRYNAFTGVCTFGMRIGDKIELINLFHEMGHLITCKDEKLGEMNWGLSYQTEYMPPYGEYNNIQTCNDVKLEINVAAWQLVLERHYLNQYCGTLDVVQAFPWLGGFVYYKCKEIQGIESTKDRDKARLTFAWEEVLELADKKPLSIFKSFGRKKLTN